eukprot:COSAG01_NODE_52681_length_345_cov_0.540650_1_plen_27_part_01
MLAKPSGLTRISVLPTIRMLIKAKPIC